MQPEADITRNIDILFVTDGSDDESPALLADVPEVRLLHRQERRGKIAAVKRAMATVESPITVLTDMLKNKQA